MYYHFTSRFGEKKVKDINDLVPKNDPCLAGVEGTEVTLTTSVYGDDENIISENHSAYIVPEWCSELWAFNEPEIELPNPLPVYVDNEEEGEVLLAVYGNPFVILRNDLILALKEVGITEFITHPVEIRDTEANEVYSNYSTFKPTQRFVNAIDEEGSVVDMVINGTAFYETICIDPEKVNHSDLFLHAIRDGSSYQIVISERIKAIFESLAEDDFIFSALFIEDEDDEYDWSEWNS